MLFEDKIKEAKDLFGDFKGEFECFASPLTDYRTRAEFSFYRDENGLQYAMFDKNSKKKIVIENFKIAQKSIQKAMKTLLNELNSSPTLTHKLFGVEFMATKDDLSVTLLYHQDVNTLKNELENLQNKVEFKLIARSKGKKLIFKDEFLRQHLQIGQNEFIYELNNDCFVQPNTNINEKMIEWVLSKVKMQQRADLLELYCGYGNFTLPLSLLFRKVLASEISKTNIKFALSNAKLNQSDNISFARLSSEELIQAFKGIREFFRLKDIDLKAFDFSHIFIDPPRVGLDESVRDFIASFRHIIYISCNPQSLKCDLDKLLKTHKITNFALFDQFASTSHLECGVILEKI